MFYDLAKSGHAVKVKGSRSSVREITGIGGVVLVLFHANITLAFGDHCVTLEDLPVVARHRGLLLGNDFNYSERVLIDHMPGTDSHGAYDGRITLRDEHGTSLGHASFTTSASLGSQSIHIAERIDSSGGSPVAYAPLPVTVPAWSETFIEARLPDAATRVAKTIAILPLDDERVDELGVLVAPGIYKIDGSGSIKVRVINPTTSRVPISAGSAIGKFMLDPTVEDQDCEFTVDEIMKQVHIDKDATDEDRMYIRQMIAERRRLFRSMVGWAHLFKATIETPDVDSGRVPPPAARNMRYSPGELEALKKEVDKLLKSHIIERTRSPYNALPMLIRKPDGTFRTVLDFRALNSVVVKDSYPLPNIEHNLAKLGKSSLFTTADLLQGFFQVELDDSSKFKTAFGTPFGQFAFVRLPMGLTSAPGIFMRAVDSALRGLPPEIALAYLDDIIVPSSGDMKQHMHDVSTVFGRLLEAGFTVRGDKVHIGMREVPYLGFMVSKHGHSPMPKRTEAIFAICYEQMQRDAKAPARFAGMIQFYHRFLPHLHFTLAPFNDLKKKSITQAQRWDGLTSLRFQAAFQLLKIDLAAVTALARPDYSKLFHLILDAASTNGGGGVVGQCQADDDDKLESLQPIAFMSFSFADEQYRYDVRGQECYVIFRAYKEWRPFLWGAKSVVHSDHKSLKWLMSTPHRPGENTATWQSYLQEFDMSIEWIPGKSNVVGDFFSRVWHIGAGGRDKGDSTDSTNDDAHADAAHATEASRTISTQTEAEPVAVSALSSRDSTQPVRTSLRVATDGTVSLTTAANCKRFEPSCRSLAKGVFLTTVQGTPHLLVEYHSDLNINLPTALPTDDQGPLRALLHDYLLSEYRGDTAACLARSLRKAEKYRPRLANDSAPTFFVAWLNNAPEKLEAVQNNAVLLPFSPAVVYSFPPPDFWFLRSLLDLIQGRPPLVNWLWRRKSGRQLLNVNACTPAVCVAEPTELPHFDPARPRRPCWVDSVAKAEVILSAMHAAVKNGGVLALDLEGFLGGDKRLNQHVSLLQLSAQGHCDELPITGVFDLHLCPEIASLPLLHEMLHNEYAVKVLHSGRGDALSLESLFGISLSNVFDTSVADSILTNRSLNNGRGLLTCLRFYLGDVDLDVKGQLVFDREVDIFAERPLPPHLFTYAYQDVVYCPDLYRAMWTALAARQLLDLALSTSARNCCIPLRSSQHNEPTILASVAIFDGTSVIAMQSLQGVPVLLSSTVSSTGDARRAARTAWTPLRPFLPQPLLTALARLGKAVRVGNFAVCIARVASCDLLLPQLCQCIKDHLGDSSDFSPALVNVASKGSHLQHNAILQYLHREAEQIRSAPVNVVTGPTVTGERSALIFTDMQRVLVLDCKKKLSALPSLAVKLNSTPLKTAQDALVAAVGSAIHKGGASSYVMPKTASIVDKALESVEFVSKQGNTSYFVCRLPDEFISNYRVSFFSSRRSCNGYRPTPSFLEAYPGFRLPMASSALKMLNSYDATALTTYNKALCDSLRPPSQHNEPTPPPRPSVASLSSSTGLSAEEHVAAVMLVFANLLDSSSERVPLSNGQVFSMGGFAASRAPSISDIRSEQRADPALSPLFDVLRHRESKEQKLDSHGQRHSLDENGILCRDGRIVVPYRLRNAVMSSVHNSNGHLGVRRTFPLLSERYYWGTSDCMRSDYSVFVGSCACCNATKLPHHAAGEHHSMETGDYPWDIVAVDKYTVGHKSNSGNTDTISYNCYFCRGVVVEPTHEHLDAKGYVQITLDRLIRRKGVPRVMISDRGSIIIAKVVGLLWKRIGTEIRASAAYRHNTVGLTERWHSVLKAMVLGLRREGKIDDWDLFLNTLELAYNATVNATTGYSAFFIEHGRHPRLPGELFTSRPKNVVLDNFVEDLLTGMGISHSALVRKLNLNAISSKERMDRRRDVTLKFKPGEKVLLVKGAVIDGVLPKAQFPTDGPYTISKVLPKDNYLIRGKHSLRFHDEIHVSRLLPANARHLRVVDALPHDANGGQWPVRCILDCRVTTSKNNYLNHPEGSPRLEYRIWWLDWPQGYATWRESEHLVNAHELVIAYHQRYGYPDGFEPPSLPADEPPPPPKLSQSASRLPHFRHSSRQTVDDPPAAPPAASPSPESPPPPVHVSRDLADRFPVKTRLEVQWLPDPTWWPGTVVKSRVYTPHDPTLWYKRDRRIEVLYDNPDLWGHTPYIHDLADDAFAFRTLGDSPSPAPEPIFSAPPPPPAPPPQGTRRSARLQRI